MEQMDTRDTETTVEDTGAQTGAAPEKTYSQADVDAMRAEWERQLKEAQTALHQQTVRHAFFRKATEQGVADADKLLQFVDLSRVTVDENGQPQGIDEIIAALTNAVAPRKSEPKTIGGPTGYPAVDKTSQSMLEEAAEKARRTGRLEDRAAFSALKQKLFGGKQ